MAQMQNANYIISSILIQLLSLVIVNAEYWQYGNATSYDLSQKLDRSKRAPFHRYIPSNILTATIKDGDEEIHLTWKRVDRYLFNQNLPVYTARIDDWGPNHRKSDIMKSIGNTIIYHDIAHKSVVMYSENMDQLYGVVGRSYEITRVPIDQLSQPLVVGGPYVHKLPYYQHGKKKLKRPVETRCLQFNGKKKKLNSAEDIASSSIQYHEHTVPEKFYVETLLFVTYDVFQYFRQQFGETSMQTLMFIYLLHFNAVDMVFANLPIDEFQIYINLAGIIIEEEDGVFSSITDYPPLKHDNRPQLHADVTIFQQLARYEDHFDFPFPKDSYDMMMVSTGRELYYGQTQFRGWHLAVPDIFALRQNNNKHSYIPMTFVRSQDTYYSYCVAAHEIGKILGIHMNDPINKDLTEEGIQCYGIMQHSKHHCSSCMKWSEESIDQLRVFMRENRNRCWLLNKPRSLSPPATPMITVSPCRQCTCFGYSGYSEETSNECPWFIPANGCGDPLQCKLKNSEGRSESIPTILPFDGTPCGEDKVCWDSKCTNL